MTSQGRTPRSTILIELMAVVLLAQLIFWFVPGFEFAYTVVPFLYIVTERHVRSRSWSEFGLKRKAFFSDLKDKWHLFVLVSIVIRFVVILYSRLWFPELYLRFWGRVEFLMEGYGRFSPVFMFVALLTLSVFLEELVFRSFIQERLGWFIGKYPAIVVSSIVFTVSHFAVGRLNVVIADLMLVFLDSSLYGLIYARSRNLLVVWVAHLLGDYVDLTLMFLL